MTQELILIIHREKKSWRLHLAKFKVVQVLLALVHPSAFDLKMQMEER